MLLFALFAAAAVAQAPAPSAWASPSTSSDSTIAFAESVERITPLGCDEGKAVWVSPLERQLELDCGKGAKALFARLARTPATLCPEAKLNLRGDTIFFHCTTTRLDAVLTGKDALELRALRALPWRGIDGPPALPEEPGESDQAGLATVRRGDAALAAGDLATALLLWRSLGIQGHASRLAQERTCELSGSNCALLPDLFDPVGLPPVLREDLLVRAARVQAFEGSPLAALGYLKKLSPSRCGDLALCRRILLVALRAPVAKGSDEALLLYLALPARNTGAAALDLAAAAAELSARLGAPRFGAALLASVTASVPEARLSDHLLRCAQLYRQGNDEVRAAAIADFAASRLDEKTLSGAAWRAFTVRLAAAPPAPEADKPSVIEAELVAAAAAIDHAQSVK